MIISNILLLFFMAITVGGFVLAWFISSTSIDTDKRPKYLIIGASISLVLLLTIPLSIFSISTGEIGVVKVFGAVKEIVTPGIHFKFWISNSVEIFDIKTREIPLEFQAYSKDAQTVTGKLAIQYQVNPDKVIEITQKYGSIDVLEEKLKAIVLERAKSVFSDKGAMAIVETRSALSEEIENRISPIIGQYHVVINMVALSDIEFNDAFESAVEQKMIAEQEKLRADYDKEKAIIKAEEQLAVAEREAKAVIQKAQGDAEALKIMQTAWSELSQEVKDAMLRQEFYEKWDGILPEVMAGENLDLIIGNRSE